jgi:hypothetical protein
MVARYWRIRLNTQGQGEFSRRAWDRNEVGVWYGAWTVNDLDAAFSRSSNLAGLASNLNALPAQRNLGWNVTTNYVGTAQRLKSIPEDDWVVLYLSDTREIALAKVQGPLCSDPKHPFNLGDGQVFKYRKLSAKKTFDLLRLPDAYRLLPAQGRGNVHQFGGMLEHVRLLAGHQNEDAVNLAFIQKPFDELLDVLGASAWESFCFAYLIWEEGFVPTGLSIGRTLPTVDLVGRRRNGSRIFAQCKKHPTKQPIDEEFRKLSETLASGDTAFYFAYGGTSEGFDSNIRLVDRAFALQWAETVNGQLYKRLLLGDAIKSSGPAAAPT